MIEAIATLDALEANMSRALYRCRFDAEHRDATLPVLAALLAEDDTAIRQRAMRAVATIGHCDTTRALAALVPLLCANLLHADELTRGTAVGALFAVGQDNPEAAVPALIDACDAESLLDRSLLALIEMGEAARSAVPCFRRFATHRNGKIRRLVMRGLGAIGADDEDSRTVLNAGLRDPNKRVRDMAQKALVKVNECQ
ncbi:MAG: HEAT repeat domain-containing protein [Planctomycetes bacterium]|nr:HEAT repeat domain-containing protein [Planctomycetota bacterium]